MPRSAAIPKNKVISFRTSDSMNEALQQTARQQGRSLSELVRYAFEHWMEQHTPGVMQGITAKHAHRHTNGPVKLIDGKRKHSRIKD